MNNHICEILKVLTQPTRTPTCLEVWAKARVIDTVHEQLGYRNDAFGNLIQRDCYGLREHAFGWEIDHIIPLSLGGVDIVENVQPFHWRANACKSNQSLWQR